MNQEQFNQDYSALIDKVYDAIEKCNADIPMIRSSISKANRKWPENTNGYFVSNIPLRLRLAIVDMSALFINIFTSKSEHVRNLNARLVSAQLYEFLEDVPKMFGKRYRKHYSTAPKFINIDEQVNVMMKSFNITRAKYHTFLKEIRNNVASHRDEDGMQQAGIIDVIDPLHIASIFMQITNWYFVDYIPYELRMIDIAEKLGFGPDLNK
ncbi:MAG TPA: hypothetical protein VL442_10355 [Mucilaginibacter sp.]|jgi:hypothetical protein|nr:hypothetical protein [Mucilaginibacter sp.]